MRRFAWFCLAVGLLVVVAACSGPGGDLRGATPVGFLRPVANPLANVTAEPVTIADLLATPEDYEGQLLEVSGTFRQRQVLVCSSRPQYSPARWALSEDEDQLPIGGVDENLESLPSGKFAITVVGRWLHWQGPVGCGRQAQVTEVRYLEVLEILSPNPITVAAAGSDAGDTTNQTELPGQPTGSEGGYPGPGTEIESEEPQITGTLTVSDTFPGPPSGSAETPVLLPTPSPPISGPNPTATPTVQNVTTPTSAPYPAAGNVTPTVTSAAPTPSPTTANGSPAPTATTGGGNTGGPTTVDQEELPQGSIETALLGENEIHRWPFVITTTAVITINIASEFDLDAVVMIEDPEGNIIAEQNDAQDGAPEVLRDIPLFEAGTYNILISGDNDTSGYYAILVSDVLDEDYYTFIFSGTLNIGDSKAVNTHANNDHFWHFLGAAGQAVNLIVTPSDDSDLFIRLFGPNDTLLVDFHDETGSGEAEELLSFTLPDTGFYSILVGEFAYNASSYTISLTGG